MTRRNYRTFVESYNNAAFQRMEGTYMLFAASKFAANGIQYKLQQAGRGNDSCWGKHL
jgi:hypothetical protein